MPRKELDMLLSRNEILTYEDRPIRRVPVPEMGKDAEILIRMMSSRGREIYEAWALRREEKKVDAQLESQDMYALMAVLSCCNEDGTPMFTMHDVEWLSQKAFTWLHRVFTEAWKLNLFDAGEVEKAADFLQVTPESASGSDLPLPSADAP
jgi:hypothetical protein